MSVRWMAVQYVGNTLRLPVVNDGDMNKPFGSSALERDVKRIVVNPFSDSPQTFVPELENAKLRELATGLYRCWQGEECEGCPMQDDGGWCVRDIQLHKLGIEVSE